MLKSKLLFCGSSGPKPTTVKDFWRMIWQENIHTIVMLTGIIEGKKVSLSGQKHKHKITNIEIQQNVRIYTLKAVMDPFLVII